MLVDSHCHLDYNSLSEDLDGVMRRALEAGVGTVLTIGTHLDKFPNVRAIAEKFNDIWCSVGVHPNEVENGSAVVAEELILLSEHEKVVGIGETGLDYYYENSSREKQIDSFIHHIKAARDTGLPLIVHSRNADSDTVKILSSEYKKGAFKCLLHCFSSGLELAEFAIEIGFYISFSGIVTFKNAHEVKKAAKLVPIEYLLIETDAPYLAPVPHRGKPNEPSYIVHTAEVIAELKGMSTNELASVTTDNFFKLFCKARHPKQLLNPSACSA